MSVTGSDHGGDPGAAGELPVGAELCAARQSLGWSLPDVAGILRIRLPFLQAIEDGRLSDLPGHAYAVGFIRSYATLLGLDPSEVLRRFRAEAQEFDRQAELALPTRAPNRGVRAGAVVLMGGLIAAGTYAGWHRWSGPTSAPSGAAAEGAAPPAVRPSPAKPPGSALAVPPPASAAPLAPSLPAAAPPSDAPRVVLRFKSDALIQVRERQGPVLLNRVMRSGETWPVPRGGRLLLTTGNAGGTEIVVDGVASPSLGPPGIARRDIPIDADTLRPGAALPSTPRGSAQ